MQTIHLDPTRAIDAPDLNDAPSPEAAHHDPAAERVVLTGTVKWFNDQKGFGFILGDGPEGRDVFVHHSVIEGQGFKTLNDGEQVEYAVEDGPKGSRAVRVRRTQGATAAAATVH